MDNSSSQNEDYSKLIEYAKSNGISDEDIADIVKLLNEAHERDKKGSSSSK